jgi:hypothetical protein
LSAEETKLMKVSVEEMKEDDPKNLNKSGLVDFDLLMLKVVGLFSDSIGRTKREVVNAF